jgi:hypothetical protein
MYSEKQTHSAAVQLSLVLASDYLLFSLVLRLATVVLNFELSLVIYRIPKEVGK